MREYVGGESHEMTSLSLPIVTKEIPATIQIRTGSTAISAKVTVTGPQQTEMATVNVSASRDGKRIASPTVAVTIGRRGVVRVGDQDGIVVEAILTGA